MHTAESSNCHMYLLCCCCRFFGSVVKWYHNALRVSEPKFSWKDLILLYQSFLWKCSRVLGALIMKPTEFLLVFFIRILEICLRFLVKVCGIKLCRVSCQVRSMYIVWTLFISRALRWLHHMHAHSVYHYISMNYKNTVYMYAVSTYPLR